MGLLLPLLLLLQALIKKHLSIRQLKQLWISLPNYNKKNSNRKDSKLKLSARKKKNSKQLLKPSARKMNVKNSSVWKRSA